MWENIAHRLEGSLVVLEPLEARHERGLFEVAQDPGIWRAALEALPARFEGIFRKHMIVRGNQYRDSAYYSIVEDEWPEVKANLRRRLAR